MFGKRMICGGGGHPTSCAKIGSHYFLLKGLFLLFIYLFYSRLCPLREVMAPNRFKREIRREVTPFNEDRVTPVDIVVAEDIPPEWKHIEAPPNFTWVGQDSLAGMGWPKSRDQIRFLISQGIDRLITLSADKIPPHYAFPELKWCLIPVEDFHGPSMRDIKKFITIMDEARQMGEAVGVHCAEGRGRTGVMCACFLIYYHDLKPWDAIRIMRRQRPGSVERKVQEDTVVRFFNLLQVCFLAICLIYAHKNCITFHISFYRNMGNKQLKIWKRGIGNGEKIRDD
jgi:atypical dual specificity phosphatase